MMANILLVDDEASLVKAQSEFLCRAGRTVSTAANGKEAMALVAHNDFDLVITDLVMPEKEGLETIAELRRVADRRRPRIYFRKLILRNHNGKRS